MLSWSELTDVSLYLTYEGNLQKYRTKSLYDNKLEQPLPKHGACCLSSLNLSEFIKEPYTNKSYFASEEFVKAVHTAVRALDKLIDENYDRHPLKEQQDMSYNYRNIGVGIFGYGTALMKMGLRYGSDEALKFTDDIFALLFRSAVMASNELAKEFGPYPNYKECVFESDIMKAHFRQDEIDVMKQYGLRNCSLISIAPTGTLANLLGETGGCEPEFAMKYTRRTVGMTDGDNTYYEVDCKAAREYKEVNKTDILPEYFVASDDIPWMDRIKTQAVMQKHVDTGISSTVNLPNEATVEDVEQLYLEAWKAGLKGITVFRKGCKRMPILSISDKKNEGDIRKVGKIRKLTTGCGSLHFNAYFYSDTGKLAEIFLNKGSTGGCNNFMICVSRLVSELAQSGEDIYKIVDQLNSCGVCSSYAVRTATKHDTSPGSCCPVAIGKALIEMYKEMQDELSNNGGAIDRSKDNKLQKTISNNSGSSAKMEQNESYHNANNAESPYNGQTCPVCHSPIEHIGGCDQCNNCGWSKCS